jgi:hypothetical protein
VCDNNVKMIVVVMVVMVVMMLSGGNPTPFIYTKGPHAEVEEPAQPGVDICFWRWERGRGKAG